MKIVLTAITCLFLSMTSMAQSRQSSYYTEKANQEVKKKKYEEALKTLTQGIHELPDSVELYDMRGTLLEAFGLYEKAIEDFTVGVEKAKDNWTKSHLLANLGGTKSRIRDFEGAYQDLKKAVAVDSTNLDALNNLAAVCDEVNKPEETIIYLERIIAVNPNYIPAYVNLGFRYQKMEQHKKAISYFDKAVELGPNEPLAYSNRSFSKLKSKDVKGAYADINKSIKLMPSNSYAYKIRALIELEKGNDKQVCLDLDKALELGYTAQHGEEVKELKAKHCK